MAKQHFYFKNNVYVDASKSTPMAGGGACKSMPARAPPWRDRVSRWKSAGTTAVCVFFINKYMTKKCLILKNEGQGRGVHHSQAAIRWWILTCIKFIWCVFCAISHHFQDIDSFKLLTMKTYVKITENRLHNDVIWGRIATSIQVIGRIFAPALTAFEMLTFQMYDLENLGQDHEVWHS